MENELLKDIVEWDTHNWGRALDFWDEHARAIAEQNESFTVLDLGAGGGGLSLYWALLGGSVLCTDWSGDFLKARALHEKHGMSDRVRYENLNAASISFPYEEAFDVVTFKSVLGGVGHQDNFYNQVLMFENIYKALKPGGWLFCCENLVASPLHMLGRKLFTDRVGGWRYVTVPEVLGLADRFELVDYTTLGVAGVFGRNELASAAFSALDRKFDWMISPKNRYIISAVFRKPKGLV